jgi:cell division protein FtsL
MGFVVVAFLLFAVLVGAVVLVMTALSSRSLERAQDGTVLRGSSRTRRDA